MNIRIGFCGVLMMVAGLALPGYSDDRDVAVTKALTQVQEKTVTANTWEGRNSDQPYVILLSEYETRIHDDWSTEETYHTRIRIQKEAARGLGEWPVYYNKAREDITQITAFVETPDGKKYEASNIQDMEAFQNSPMYSDMKVKIITLPQVNVGSMLDVTVKSKTRRKEIPNQFWDEVLYPQVPTKLATHTYVFPLDKPIAFKAYKHDYKPRVEKKSQIKYSFIFENTEDTEDEEMMPPLDEVKGGLYLSSISDWKAVADWYRGLVNRNMVEDEELTERTLKLIAEKNTQKDKARAILEFIQDNFRYVALSFGEHTVEPHPSNEVYRNRYGDCKDISLLVKQMFKIAGIDSNICLMTTEYKGSPQNMLPNPAVFEHVVLEAGLDGETFFVDPQTKGFDFGQYPAAFDNAHVMVIDDIGYRFDHLPIAGEADRTLINQGQVTVGSDGSAQFDVMVRLPLEASQTFRSQWDSTTTEDRKKFFESLEANYTQGGTMVSHEVKNLDSRYGPVEFHLVYHSPNAYPMVNDMILLREADQSDLPDFTSRERKYPMFIPTNSLIKHTNVYRVPDGYEVDFVPANYKLSIDFVDIGAEYTKGDGQITVSTIYRMKRAVVAPERYEEVRKFRNEVYKKNDQYIVLKKKGPTSSEARGWLRNQ